MIIREIKEQDFEGLMRLYSQLTGTPVPEKDEELTQLWQTVLEDKNHHVIVAEKDGQLIATCVCVIIPNLTKHHRPYAFIENVVTDEAYRGQGVGSACLEYAKELAEKENCYKMMLMTGCKKESVYRFYEKAGYNSEDKIAFVRWL